MTQYHYNSKAVIEGMECLIAKFLRARTERSVYKLYHDMENSYGYVLLSGNEELCAILREMIDRAKKIKNVM